MAGIEDKSLAILRILNILETYSDCDHPLKQEDIAKYLERDYGIKLDRKAIGRKVNDLKSVVEIESTRHGCFLAERRFEDSELKMLIDGVLSSKYITAKHSKQLIEKLCGLSNKYFRSHVKNVYSVNDWGKTDNCAVFYNVEIIDEAIERKRQIRFDYNKYGADKKLHKTKTHTVSPYQLMLHNQRYYLISCNEQWKNIGHYRLDKITDIEIVEDAPITDIRTLEGHESGLDYREMASALPYMFTDKPEMVEMRVDKGAIDSVVDWFGYNITVKEEGEGYKVRLKVSLNAMEYWAMQFLNSVEIISPASLREKIKNNLASATEKYNK